MSTFRDFDKAWAEKSSEAPSFKAFGETFVLPKSPPVKLTLVALRAAQKGDPDAEVPPEQVLDIAAMLIGKDNVKVLLDKGMDFEQLGDLVNYAKDAYTSKDDEPDPPTAGTPEPAEPSSPTGDTSKPTSNASTDWIS